MKPSLLLFCLFPIWLARADRASLGMYVEDAQSGAPLSGVKVIARFEDDIGWRAWAEEAKPDVKKGITDLRGMCRLSGKTNWSRRRTLRLARIVNGLLTGVWLTDAHNGFRALSRKAMESIRLQEDRMAHASEILILMKKAGLRWKEIPVHVNYTEYSVAKGQRLGAALEILSDLLLGKMR